MAPKIGFTGSRKGISRQQKEALLQILATLTPSEIHHGDCVGADREFHLMCRDLLPECSVVVHPPSDPKHRAFCEGDVTRAPSDYLARNRRIVAQSVLLVACPNGPPTARSGTWYTVRQAVAAGRPHLIVWPDGRIEPQSWPGSLPRP